MNTTTSAQRTNARQDKIWECCKAAKQMAAVLASRSERDASRLNKSEATTAETSNQQIERDYEPEQSYGTAHDFKEHTRFGGTREDY